jgi:hypothetical protein
MFSWLCVKGASSGLEPRYGGLADIVAPGHIGLSLAFLEPLEGFLPLVQDQLRPPTELHKDLGRGIVSFVLHSRCPHVFLMTIWTFVGHEKEGHEGD